MLFFLPPTLSVRWRHAALRAVFAQQLNPVVNLSCLLDERVLIIRAVLRVSNNTDRQIGPQVMSTHTCALFFSPGTSRAACALGTALSRFDAASVTIKGIPHLPAVLTFVAGNSAA
jgi:hypothetical protein